MERATVRQPFIDKRRQKSRGSHILRRRQEFMKISIRHSGMKILTSLRDKELAPGRVKLATGLLQVRIWRENRRKMNFSLFKQKRFYNPSANERKSGTNPGYSRNEDQGHTGTLFPIFNTKFPILGHSSPSNRDNWTRCESFKAAEP